MGQRPTPAILMPIASQPLRRAVLSVSAALLLAACGAGHTVSVGAASTTTATSAPSVTTASSARSGPSPTTPAPTTAPPTSAPPPTTVAPTSTTSAPGAGPSCSSTQLSVDQVPLSEGTGHYYLAWSLTNHGSAACVLAAGHPTLALVDAAGRSVVTYPTTDLPGGSASALVVAPSHVAWFLTEELSTSCPAPATVTGGPFDYVVTLPGGATPLTWSPTYLATPTLTDLCTDVPISIGGLQAAEPRP